MSLEQSGVPKKILVVTQVFWPDTVSVGQHLWDLAEALEARGASINVLTSMYSYEAGMRFKSHEQRRTIKIARLWQTHFGKGSMFKRALDSLSFLVNAVVRLMVTKRNAFDGVVTTTSPPMLAWAVTWICKLKGWSHFHWVMDIQPALGIASGDLNPQNPIVRFSSFMSKVSLRAPERLGVLDDHMATFLRSQGVDQSRIALTPVWPVSNAIQPRDDEICAFRSQHGWAEKIVIMFSGNHALVHPVATLLEASLGLRGDERFHFVFVGGGVRSAEVRDFKEKHGLENIQQLPLFPRDMIHLSLSSGDMQVVLMGDGLAGFTHPNKVYGALQFGIPVLYVGPSDSHVSDAIKGMCSCISVRHGQVTELVEQLRQFAQSPITEQKVTRTKNRLLAEARFSPDRLKAIACNSIYQVLDN